ncbi:phospholipid-transporting ATPase ABCA3-like [Physella acuta]|uniref:phospholipid-transporting ATPase ABCA3-like n=1 Tax=Physella acuta TaxID=109671 RepID=UPI0027DDFFA2|nr:phospholipid-transporting ATPase ABCA3-like [Physella acuta]
MPVFISQFCALTYKNVKHYQYSIVTTLIEIGLTLIIGKLMSLGISKMDTTASIVNDIESLIKPEVIYMPNTNNFKELFNKGQISSSTTVKATPVDSLSQMEKSYNIWENVQTWKQEKHVIMFEQPESSADKVPAKLDFKVVLFEPVPASKTLNRSFDFTQAGLTSAQLLVTKSYLNYWKQEKHMLYNTDFSIKTQKIPDTIMDVCEKNLIYLPAIFVVFTIVSTIYIAEEKNTNIKDTLKDMGVSQLIYWISWFFDRMAIGLVLTSFVVAHWLSTLDSVFVQHVSKAYFIIWFLLMVINNLTLAFVLACLLPGKFIVPLTMITYGMLNALSYTLIPVKVTFIKIMAGLLLFSHGNRICVGAIFTKEILYGNVKDSANVDKQFLEGALYIILNSVFNCFIVFAVETISNIKKYRTNSKNMEKSKSQSQNEKLFEAVAGSQNAGIVIQDLVKVYGDDTVVSGINLDIYKDQITMLLGHNGAGKSTVLSMVMAVWL